MSVNAKTTPKKRVQSLQDRLGHSAKLNPKRRYGNLFDKVYRNDVLHEAWRRVSRNRGAPGVDGQSIQWIRENGVDEFLADLATCLKAERYHPLHVKRVFIAKPDGSLRPLGIPAVIDRVVQMAVKLVIEPLFEADFLSCSFGFRPKKSSHQAIRLIEDHLYRGYRWVVDVDLKSYFDTIAHEPLLEMVQQRVTDRKIVRLIRYWLKAGVLEDGVVTYPELGSPQGGVLSPLLANIYLHRVDQEWQKRQPREVLVRYADDMLIMCPTQADAERAYSRLQEVLSELSLTLNASKTRITAARDGFDFLGFSFRRGFYTRRGCRREIIIKVPRAKAEKAMRAKIKKQIKSIKLGDALDSTVPLLNRRLRGWVGYFRISNVRPALKGLVRYACEQLRLHLRRRFHRKRSQYSRRWPDGLFHQHYGLLTVSELLPGS